MTRRYLAVVVAGVALAGCSTAKRAPDPHSNALNATRSQTVAKIDGDFATVQHVAGLTEIETASDDRCEQGTNNWKIHDGYAYRCSVRITKFYGFDDNASTTAIAVEDALLDAGWHQYRPDVHEVAKAVEDAQQYAQQPMGSGSTPGSIQYLNQMCPFNRFEEHQQTACLMVASRDHADLNQLGYTQDVMVTFETYADSHRVDPAAVLTRTTRNHHFLLAVSIEAVYFQN